MGVDGSSPRSRGTYPFGWVLPVTHRFIPALAGNMGMSVFGREPNSVHPRARGEHSNGTSLPSRRTGSSPRSRGTYCCLSRRTFPFSVHPRARGEHLREFGEELACDGSSPRSRGTSAPWHLDRLDHPVHPRARGEHTSPSSMTWSHVGSSPRSRGTFLWRTCCLSLWRFIPALAGNIVAASLSRCQAAVHPRARGEHIT